MHKSEDIDNAYPTTTTTTVKFTPPSIEILMCKMRASCQAKIGHKTASGLSSPIILPTKHYYRFVHVAPCKKEPFNIIRNYWGKDLKGLNANTKKCAGFIDRKKFVSGIIHSALVLISLSFLCSYFKTALLVWNMYRQIYEMLRPTTNSIFMQERFVMLYYFFGES